MTDIPRLRRGHVGAQFWSVFIPVEVKGPQAVQETLEQIDLVKAMCARYRHDLAMAYSAADITRLHRAGVIASLIGVEGGHQINDSLAVLRHVGLGSDFDGVPETPTGLEGVDRFPALLQELARRGWSDADLGKVAGGNLLRVMSQAESVSARLRSERPPSNATRAALDGPVARAKAAD